MAKTVLISDFTQNAQNTKKKNSGDGNALHRQELFLSWTSIEICPHSNVLDPNPPFHKMAITVKKERDYQHATQDNDNIYI